MDETIELSILGQDLAGLTYPLKPDEINPRQLLRKLCLQVDMLQREKAHAESTLEELKTSVDALEDSVKAKKNEYEDQRAIYDEKRQVERILESWAQPLEVEIDGKSIVADLRLDRNQENQATQALQGEIEQLNEECEKYDKMWKDRYAAFLQGKKHVEELYEHIKTFEP